MKIREGFVSNSSSSSFCLASKKKKDFKIAVELDLDDLVKAVITTEDELVRYLTEEMSWDKDRKEWSNYEEEKYEKYCSELQQGNNLIFGSCSSEDDNELSCYLHNKGFPMLKGTEFTVIDDTEC